MLLGQCQVQLAFIGPLEATDIKIQSEGPREKYPLNSVFPKTVLKGIIQHSRVSETYFTELKEVLSTHVSYYPNLKSKTMD